MQYKYPRMSESRLHKTLSTKDGALCLLGLLASMFLGCVKWNDSKPVTDPRLTNPYCNDPAAVNYNWGFPGKPDNSICIYPTDKFSGRFLFIDSMYSESGASAGNFVGAQTDTLIFTVLSHTKMTVSGLGGKSGTLNLTAYTFTATIDTTVGDSLTANSGQLLGATTDTVNGTIFYSMIDSQLHINLQIINDTGMASHSGKAKRL